MRRTLALFLLPLAPLIQAAAPAPAPVAQAGPQDAALLQFLDEAFDEQMRAQPGEPDAAGLQDRTTTSSTIIPTPPRCARATLPSAS
jgi:hypothetical protein